MPIGAIECWVGLGQQEPDELLQIASGPAGCPALERGHRKPALSGNRCETMMYPADPQFRDRPETEAPVRKAPPSLPVVTAQADRPANIVPSLYAASVAAPEPLSSPQHE